MDCEIIIVSGLPRSGTSLMMQMLESGGVDVVTDNIRTDDINNPRGYYELEKVKRTKQDPSWLPRARGKAVKMVSQLLYDLPTNERYRIILMERDLDEMLISQERMLKRLNRAAAPRDELKRSYLLHLGRLCQWLRQQPHIRVLRVSYNDLVAQPQREAQRVSEFLDGKANAERMAAAVDPSLYRNRKNAGDTPHDTFGRSFP
jgi:hypothetical protein